MLKLPIYLDNNATTPLDPRVLEAMMPYLTDVFGNAASRNHPFGWAAEEGVDYAREQIAKLINCDSKEIIFTSGATESDNLGIKGVFEMYSQKGNHVITATTEHKAVLDTCKHIEKLGGRVTYLPVDEKGLISLADLEAAMTPETILVTIMYGNNETGTINPIREIAKIAHSHGALFMTDGTQAVGKIPVDVIADGIDIMAFTAHKMYGPKGVGALYVRRKNPRVKVTAQMDGGGHERGMRSGTLNVPGIVGLGKACELARLEMDADTARLERDARPPRKGADDDGRKLRERLGGAPPAARYQHQLQVCGRRRPDDGREGPGRIVGLGLHLGLAGAQLRAQGPGPERRFGPQQPALRPEPLHHRRANRLRHRPRKRGCDQAPRNVAPVGDVPGRHRFEQNRVGRTLIQLSVISE